MRIRTTNICWYDWCKFKPWWSLVYEFNAFTPYIMMLQLLEASFPYINAIHTVATHESRPLMKGLCMYVARMPDHKQLGYESEFVELINIEKRGN